MTRWRCYWCTEFCTCSARAAARGFVICDMLISASDKKINKNNSTTITNIIQRSIVDGALASIALIAAPRVHDESLQAQWRANEMIRDICVQEPASHFPHQVCRDRYRARAKFRAPTATPSRHLRFLHEEVPASLPQLGKSLRHQVAMANRQYQIHLYFICRNFWHV